MNGGSTKPVSAISTQIVCIDGVPGLMWMINSRFANRRLSTGTSSRRNVKMARWSVGS